jgi:hypothetical protein
MATMKPETKALKALEKLVELQEKLAEAKRKAGIARMESEIDRLKGTITNFMIEADEEHLYATDGHYATLIKATYDAHFVGTKDEIPEDIGDRKVIPLRTIIYKKLPKEEAAKLWQRVTKRVVVTELVEEVVAEGILVVNEISPAFVEKSKKPYVRIYDGRA